MSVTGYKPVAWNKGDNLTIKKLNVMTNNEQWLFDNMIRADYHALGVHKNTGIRLMAGATLIRTNQSSGETVAVHFSNFFSAGTSVIVTTGVVSQHMRRIFVSVNGFGKMHPDNRGFMLHVSADTIPSKPNRIYAPFYVSWTAVGF